MRFYLCHFGLALGLTIVLLSTVDAATTTTTLKTTRQLRGKPIIHTRTIHNHGDDPEQEHGMPPEPLVEPNQPHQKIRMRGTGHSGETREFEIDVSVLEKIGKEQYKSHDNNDKRNLGYHLHSDGHEQMEHTPPSRSPQQAPTNDQMDARMSDVPQKHDSHHEKKKTFKFRPSNRNQ